MPDTSGTSRGSVEADVPEMPTQSVVTTGRPIDADGNPIGGDERALSLDPDGRAVRLLAESPRALASSPGAGTWATLLARPDDDDVEHPELLQWLAPDASAPPEHYHPTTETFEAVTGEFTVVVDGETRRLAPGESVTVPPGTVHTFRNDTDETIAFRAELPSMRTVRSLYSVWGRDHEGAFAADGYGEPGALDALRLARFLHGETTMPMAPVVVQRVFWGTLGRLADAVGEPVVDDRYLTDEFWRSRVEQPEIP